PGAPRRRAHPIREGRCIMTIDLDALEAQIEGTYDVCHVNAQDITDLIAELRQERERADGLEANRRLWIADAFEYESADLSRAEETIARALSALDPSTGDGAALDEARTILTEYGKQK